MGTPPNRATPSITTSRTGASTFNRFAILWAERIHVTFQEEMRICEQTRGRLVSLCASGGSGLAGWLRSSPEGAVADYRFLPGARPAVLHSISRGGIAAAGLRRYLIQLLAYTSQFEAGG